jgi:UDP-glucose 4-epimerase
MRILVTGGEGFVGRHLCQLLASDHQVHVVDNLRYGAGGQPDVAHRRTLHVADIRAPEKIQELCAELRPELVYHLAAIHYIPECEQDPTLAVSTNVTGTVNMLMALAPGTRVVLVSSVAVYAPDVQPHLEDTSEVRPCDIYGFTKRHAEQYLEYLAVARGLRARIVRLSNVVGPGETNPHVLPVIIGQLQEGAQTLRLGNIHPKRDYIHVSDAAEGLARIAELGTGASPCEIFNLGTGSVHSVLEMVTILGEIIGRAIKIESDPGRVRENDRPVLCADMSKTIRRTGWEPKFSFRAALADTWKHPALATRIDPKKMSET